MATEEISCETKVKTKIRLNLKDLDKHYNGDGKLNFRSGVNLKPKTHSYQIGKPSVIDHPNKGKCIGFLSFGVKNLVCEFDLEVLLSNSTKIKIVESCNSTEDVPPIFRGYQRNVLCIDKR